MTFEHKHEDDPLTEIPGVIQVIDLPFVTRHKQSQGQGDNLGRLAKAHLDSITWKNNQPSEDYICSILIDRSPSMQKCWKDFLRNMNENISKIKSRKERLHISLLLMDQNMRTRESFTPDPKELMADNTNIRHGTVKLYDNIYMEILRIAKYIRLCNLKDPKVRIIVFSPGRDTRSVIRSIELKRILKQPGITDLKVRFGYESKDSEDTAKRIGVEYSPCFTPPEVKYGSFSF